MFAFPSHLPRVRVLADVCLISDDRFKTKRKAPAGCTLAVRGFAAYDGNRMTVEGWIGGTRFFGYAYPHEAEGLG